MMPRIVEARQSEYKTQQRQRSNNQYVFHFEPS